MASDARVKLAKHALRWGDSTLDDIANSLGYADRSRFGRAFKNTTGSHAGKIRK